LRSYGRGSLRKTPRTTTETTSDVALALAN
jgi:hypothetical protein